LVAAVPPWVSAVNTSNIPVFQFSITLNHGSLV
jgi:hypothetical protein